MKSTCLLILLLLSLLMSIANAAEQTDLDSGEKCELALKYFLSRKMFATQPIDWSSHIKNGYLLKPIISLPVIAEISIDEPYLTACQFCPRDRWIPLKLANDWCHSTRETTSRDLEQYGKEQGGLSPAEHLFLGMVNEASDPDGALKEFVLASADVDLRRECLYHQALILHKKTIDCIVRLDEMEPHSISTCQLLASVYDSPALILRVLREQLKLEEILDSKLRQGDAAQSEEDRKSTRYSRLRRILKIKEWIEEIECVQKIRNSRDWANREKKLQETLQAE